MATSYQLKPFRFNFSDLNFIRNQINFRPLFDANGNAIIAWDGTGAAYSEEGIVYADLGSAAANVAAYGQSYASVTASQGLRDVSGTNNNLYLENALWGANDRPFLQRTQVVFDQYVKPLDASDPNAYYALKFATAPDSGAANYTKFGDNLATLDINEASGIHNVIDYTPRMISQLTTTAGATFATNGVDTHLVKDANGFTQVANYGMLESLGQQDAQRSVNADGTANNEFFVGAQNPGVSPVNGWFVLFGQFFDHGLDFVGKGGDGTKITINLSPDDPMYGVIDPTTGQPATKIVISRADVSGFTADGTPQWNNHTSPYIDQSQTYGSDQEVTDLLRAWVSTDGGLTYHASSNLLDGDTSVAWKNAFGETTNATLPTLNELRAHLIETGRADLTWEDVSNLRNRDADGNVVAGTSGQALILDSNPRFDAAHFTNVRNPEAGVAFDNNIQILSDAAAAMGATFSYNGTTIVLDAPAGTFGPSSPAMIVTGASALALWVNFGDFSIKTSMQAGPDVIAIVPAVHDAVSDLLLASVGDHYIAGDGRVNENIGLTAVHHVWHEEHNFQVRNIQEAVIAEDIRQERLDQFNTSYNHELLHEWQVDTGNQDPLTGNFLNTDGSIAWNEDKLFHAAKITVEMEYQHTAVDQFARTITPNIAEFVGYNSGEQADVSLDFAQVAYRFGHSTLRESIDLIDPNQDITGAVMRVALERAFLSPELFAQKGAAAIALGMTHQQANEVDEFVTPALNQGLLGLPLDLAAINIARGRDLGIPTLNEFRAAIGLTEYVSWADFGANMIHPDNLVSFIAAYSFDGNVERAAAIIGLDNGNILEGDAEAMGYTYDQALNFMNNTFNNATEDGAYGADGFQHIDTWLGGLAEVHVTGGLLGETFDTVFADQISRLMNGDRFYYLYRLDQLQMGEGIINEQFKDIVERNTGAEHLNGSVFAYADKYYDLSENEVTNAKTEHKYADALSTNPTLGVYSTKGNATTGNGAIVSVGGVQYIRDIRVLDSAATSGTTAINGGMNLDGTENSGAESHEVIVATDRNDLIYAWGGDDTIYGEAGDDVIYGGNGIDRLYGGDGNDRIYGGDGGDLLDGGAGDDYVSGEQTAVAAAGIDQVIGGEGNDILHSGIGIDKLSGESGDDFIFGEGDTDAFTHGGDGNDIIDGGTGGDLLWGDDGDDLIIGGDDQDISAGLNGDDILRPGGFSQAMGGGPDEVLGGDGKTDAGNDGNGFGFDMIDFSDHAYSPQGVKIIFSTQQNPAAAIDLTTPFPAWVGIEGVIASKSNDTITADETNNFGGSNWLIGGSGNDTITGGVGNDVIVGDGIRLDSLIGTYAGGYDQSFDGASHRATGFVQANGLLDNIGGGFAKHYTNMLSSATFKDLELGGHTVSRLWRNGVTGSDLADSVTVGDGGTTGTADTVVFTGNRADYIVEKISFATQNQGTITAYKISDTVIGRDDTDVVVGIENFKFANGTFNETEILDIAPEITSDGGGAVAALAVAENTLAVTTVTATDANNVVGNPLNPQLLTFSISGGADAALFAIDANTGVLSFVNAPDFEAPTDVTTDVNGDIVVEGNNVYDVIVQVYDGILVDTQTLAVTVTNVNEAATGALKISSYTTTNNAARLTATNTIADPDGMTNFVQYQWQRQTVAPTAVNPNGTWVNIAGAITATLENQSNTTVRVTSSYSDPFGINNIVSAETAFITGSGNNNTKVGTAGNDIMLGLGGNDTLTGGLGNDIVDGGTGNDRLIAMFNDGNDVYIGGTGTDTYDLSSTNNAAIVNLSTGSASSAQTGIDTLSGIENVTGSLGNDTVIDGLGSNQLDGRGGNDSFVMTADNARDIINGETGNDTVDYSTFTANLSVSLDGGNQVNVSGSGLVNANRDQIRNVENFIGGSGNDNITGDGLANQLTGGSGNDTLRGGNGNDTLVGGIGNDIFDYNGIGESGTTAATRDIILGFEGAGIAGGDIIDLSGIGGTFSFIGTDAFASNGFNQLRYQTIDTNGDLVNDSTIIQLDNDNDTGVESSILLMGVTTLTAGDFSL